MILEATPLVLDMVTFRLTGAYGAPCWLAPDQASVLATLMRRPDVIISRDALVQAVYGRGRRPPTAYRLVDARIYRLRQKLDLIGGRGMIRSLHDEGYMLTKPHASVIGLHQRWLTDEQVQLFDALVGRSGPGAPHA